MSDYVYFVGHEDAVKIGHSVDPYKRIKSIQNGSPKPVEVFATVWCDEDATFIERELHIRFNASRLKGEWFKHTPELDFIINYLGSIGEIKEKQIKALRRSYNLYKELSVAKDPSLIIPELTMLGLAYSMCEKDLTDVGIAVSAEHLKAANIYYRDWLLKINYNFQCKRYKDVYIEKPSTSNWKVITPDGKVHVCRNYFDPLPTWSEAMAGMIHMVTSNAA